MTDQQPETTEDQRPAEAPETHPVSRGYGVTRKFAPGDYDVQAAEREADDDEDLEDDE